MVDRNNLKLVSSLKKLVSIFQKFYLEVKKHIMVFVTKKLSP